MDQAKRIVKLSILDLIPVLSNQKSGDAIAATTEVVKVADRLGVERYWFAEHHNMPSVASTTPPVTIASMAAQTERIKLGSGGVMLPNHASFTVAEQFAMLEAMAPGRIELGLGRAPGSDPVITALLRSSGPTSDVDLFRDHVRNLIAMSQRAGAELQLAGGQHYSVRATPVADRRCPVWLLGSSDYSASLAAEMGLPYVFAHHFSGEGTERALALYRNNFRPSEYAEVPTTFVTLNVSVADTQDEARARAMPHLIQMSRLRTGKPLTTLHLVDDVADEPLDAMQTQIIEQMMAKFVIADADSAAQQIRAHADRFGVDEVMMQFASANYRDEPVDRSPGREHALQLLADRLL